MGSVAKSARIWSRRPGAAVGFAGLVFGVFWGRGFIAGFLGCEQVLIVAGGTRADDVFAQAWIEHVAVQSGEFIGQRLGPGVGGQDAANRGQREGTEANGAIQGCQDSVTMVLGHQRQQFLRLPFALDLLGEQKSRITCTSATLASQWAATSLRCSSDSKVRPLSRLVWT